MCALRLVNLVELFPGNKPPGFRACKRKDAVPVVSARGSHESRVADSPLSPVYKCAQLVEVILAFVRP